MRTGPWASNSRWPQAVAAADARAVTVNGGHATPARDAADEALWSLYTSSRFSVTSYESRPTNKVL